MRKRAHELSWLRWIAAGGLSDDLLRAVRGELGIRGAPAGLDRLESAQEILAELPGTHERLQVAVRGADEPEVDLPALLAADARHQAVLEHPQELHLHGERHVRDFIEEQGAAVGLLEDAASRPHRAGEGVSFVSEELGFQQGLRNGAAVDGDEGRSRPGKAGACSRLATSSLPTPDSPVMTVCDE